MGEYDLSIIIPARNEEFLNQTIQDLLIKKRGRTQIIVGLDGQWPVQPIDTHPDVVILFYPESIGQRAISNRCASLSQAPYLMKVDAHCAFDEGFDLKMLDLMQPDITMVPVMRNLHVFDWVCEDGHRRYQDTSGPCPQCGKPEHKEIVWLAKTNPQSTAYTFDREMHFQYWNEFGKAQQGDLTETMSLQGSCFLIAREKWWELAICSEAFHSWGQQGVEVACKTWLSGGRVLVNRTTWYAHMFRTKGGDFGFPYPLSGREVQANREKSREMFQHNQWAGAKRSFQWLLDKFNPPHWRNEPAVSRGILYYTDNALNMRLARKCRQYITAAGLPVTSVSLKPLDFGRNVVFQGERSYRTMFRQILAGLEAMKEEVVYFAEHDTLYHPEHFRFVPREPETWYYNGNYWVLRLSDGFAVHYNVSPLSGLVVHRESAIKHFRERIAYIEAKGYHKHGFSFVGFEPFTHKRIPWEYWCKYEVFTPESPNIDICHGGNATQKRFSQEHFRRKPTFWEEGNIDQIPGWANLREVLV